MNSYKIEQGILHIYKDCDAYNPVTKMTMREKWFHCENGKFINAILHFKNPNSNKWEKMNLKGEPFSFSSFRISCLPTSINDCLNCKYSDCINAGVRRVTVQENVILKEYFPNNERDVLTIDEKIKRLKGL